MHKTETADFPFTKYRGTVYPHRDIRFFRNEQVFAMTSYLRQVIHLPLDTMGILQSHKWEIFTLLTQCQDF